MVDEEFWGKCHNRTHRVDCFLLLACMHLRIQPLFRSFTGLKPRPGHQVIRGMKMQGANEPEV